MAKYKWAAGFSDRAKADPNVVGPHLHALLKKKRKLEPEDVLNDAKAKASPLHPLFLWNDSAAAEKWRLSQAVVIIGSIRVLVRKDNKETERHLVVNISQPGNREPVYVDSVDVYTDAQWREELLKKAIAEIRSWRMRHAELKELSTVFTLIDQLRDPETTQACNEGMA